MAAAAIVAVRNNRNHDDYCERRKTALEDRDNFWKDLEERLHFRDLMASFDADKSGDLDATELRSLIQKYGQGVYLDLNGNQLDIMHSGGGRHYPSSPTDDEISWILAASSKVKKNRIVASELKFSLVSVDLLRSSAVLSTYRVAVKLNFQLPGNMEQLREQSPIYRSSVQVFCIALNSALFLQKT